MIEVADRDGWRGVGRLTEVAGGSAGWRRREERRVSEGRYDDFGWSDEGGVKGLS